MPFSRSNPSARYQYLISQYKTMHVEGERHLGLPPEQVFPGQSLFSQAARIKRLIDRTGALNLLDYGAGKGFQYNPVTVRTGGIDAGETVMDFWGIDNVHCYDPCHVPFSSVPTGTFDGVISTDVLEHCPEEDIDWIVGEMFGFAERFVFANVACYPALKRLPDGENAHCTIKAAGWWEGKFRAAAASHPGLLWDVWIQYPDERPDATGLTEKHIGNAEAAV